MSEQIENPPNKETEMVTSQEEASEDQPENPPQQHSVEQPEEKEEEENKKTVTEEKRLHESAKEDDDSDSQRGDKKSKQSVDSDKDDKNPRNVPLESDQLEPFLVRLEHDPETQLSFWTGLENYRREKGVYPFDIQTSMEDFLNNWLLVRVPWLDFQQTFQRLRQNYTTTGAAIAGNLNSLNPTDREVFLLTNKILSAYHTERREKKRKIQATTSTFSNKPVLIAGSKLPPKPPRYPLKQQKTKIVLDTKQKQKQKLPEYMEKKEVKPRAKPQEKKREKPEEKKKENPVKEKKENPVEEQKENPEQNPNEDSYESWTNANFDTLYAILHAITDYKLSLDRFPYDDASDMEDFVKNWLRINISVSDCLEVIKKLKKYYKKQFFKVIDHGMIFPNKKQEQLYNTLEFLWDVDGNLEDSDDEGEKEEKKHSDDEGEKEEKKQSDDKELGRPFEGGGNLKWKRPNVKKQLNFSELEYNPEQNPNEDSDEAWTNANFDTLYAILHAITDYNLSLDRFPYDDASDMEDFVKNWLRINISVSDCLEIIKKLKKYYKKQFFKVIDHGMIFPNKKQEQLYNTLEFLWDVDGNLEDSDDEGDKEEKKHLDDEGDKEEKKHSEDEGDKEEKKESDDKELGHPLEGGGNLKWKRPNVKNQLNFSELEYNPETRSMLPFLVKNSLQQGIGGFSDVMPVQYPVPLAMLWPPILPFQVTAAGAVNNKQKAGTSEDSSSMNRNDLGEPNSQSDDPAGKPHDEKPEDGSEHEPDESKSSGKEIKE
ncbi:hypothetical protein JRO89_XS15G0143000 [Xanthoceras sorbifolium]|uniref:Uncharacterized protein n=1 Tax=Xanthoceras sorbifolium TaxID=99658 RepID=A0ABQ8H257_9ROSI|nr:hypothetical protein JRO89_XS15G0143000 [Xanthoceras sorbifolium]